MTTLGRSIRLTAGIVAALSAAALSGQTPAKTATPAPRLSGGFGRPRNTPPPTGVAETGGQSLSDVVTAAKTSSSGAPEKSTMTIDNRSLVKNPSKGRVSTSRASNAAAHPAPSPAQSVPTPAAQAAAGASPAAAGDVAPPSPGTEAEWKDIATRTRKRVADDKAHVEELSAATKKLENDFYAWDDGQYRDRVIKPSWDRSRTDLETARQELAQAEKDLADLPEKARKAGALPGWIRE
jgi:hypothetical protein